MSALDAESFRARYGPWALVAGGSEGLGAEFVRALAALGLDVLAVAERPDPLHEHCARVARETGVEVRPAVVDLSRPDMLSQLRTQSDGLEVGLLVCNAAVSSIGRFLDQPLEHLEATVALNCRAPALLCREYGAAMVRRGRGGIVLMSSMAGRQGTALVTAYAASKAFDLVLGEGLHDELRDEGVSVLAMCPGATRTPGWERSAAKIDGLVRPPVMEPADVVSETLRTLGRRPSAVAGRANRWASWILTHVLGRRRAVALMGRRMRAQYPAEAAAPSRSAPPRGAS
ncbi:MAG: SDR family NAD(P)-dependent oxidoreductase [Myxococcota bacterium]